MFVDDVGGHVDDWRLRRRFHAALERAGLPKLRLHDLRHTFGTLAVQAFPLSDVKAYMGHADIQTTMIYVHHVPADRRRRQAQPARRRPHSLRLSGHVRDTNAETDDATEAEIARFPATF